MDIRHNTSPLAAAVHAKEGHDCDGLTFHCVARSAIQSHYRSAFSGGPSLAASGPYLNEVGPLLLVYGRFLVDSGSSLTKVSNQIWSIPVRVGSISGQFWSIPGPMLVDPKPSLAEVGAHLAEFGPMLFEVGPIWSTPGQFGPNVRFRARAKCGVYFGQAAVELPEFGPTLVDPGPKVDQIGRSQPQLGRTRPQFGVDSRPKWPMLVKGVQHLGALGQNSTAFGASSAKLDPDSDKFGRSQPELVRLGRNLARIPRVCAALVPERCWGTEYSIGVCMWWKTLPRIGRDPPRFSACPTPGGPRLDSPSRPWFVPRIDFGSAPERAEVDSRTTADRPWIASG